MSRAFTGSTNGSFAQVDKAAVSAPPFTVSLWFRTSAPTRTGYLFWLGDRLSGGDWYAVSLIGSKARAETRAGSSGSWPAAISGNSAVANKASHICATFSAGSREIILDGVAAVTDSTAQSPSTPNRTALARSADSSPSGGAFAEIAHVAIWNRALTTAERALLAQGANPQSIPNGLVEYWPLAGSANPEPGALGAGLNLSITGAAAGALVAPVQPYAPPPPAGEGSVKKIWTSGLKGIRYPAERPPYATFSGLDVPMGSGTRRLIALVAVMPFAAGTTVQSVAFASMPMTRLSPDRWTGPESSANVTAWAIDLTPENAPGGAASLHVACSGALWCAAAQLWALDDAGTAYIEAGAATAAESRTATQTIATEPGSLVLFMAALQGRDGMPVGLAWDGGAVDGLDATSGSSITTDLSVISASKLVAAGTSETATANFSTSDGRGWLMLSIPPAAEPPPSAEAVGGADQRRWHIVCRTGCRTSGQGNAAGGEFRSGHEEDPDANGWRNHDRDDLDG